MDAMTSNSPIKFENSQLPVLEYLKKQGYSTTAFGYESEDDLTSPRQKRNQNPFKQVS